MRAVGVVGRMTEKGRFQSPFKARFETSAAVGKAICRIDN